MRMVFVGEPHGGKGVAGRMDRVEMPDKAYNGGGMVLGHKMRQGRDVCSAYGVLLSRISGVLDVVRCYI